MQNLLDVFGLAPLLDSPRARRNVEALTHFLWELWECANILEILFLEVLFLESGERDFDPGGIPTSTLPQLHTFA